MNLIAISSADQFLTCGHPHLGRVPKLGLIMSLLGLLTKVSKSRIKRLRGMSQPQFRLRVGDIRVFYDVTETAVEILAIVGKDQVQAWLDEEGTRATDGGTS